MTEAGRELKHGIVSSNKVGCITVTIQQYRTQCQRQCHVRLKVFESESMIHDSLYQCFGYLVFSQDVSRTFLENQQRGEGRGNEK